MPSVPKEDGDGWRLVATWLEQEMQLKGLSKRAIVDGVRMDQRTLDKLLAGDGIARKERLAGLAEFLGYRGDAIDLVRRAEEPVRAGATDEATELRFRALERRMDRLEGMLETALQPPDRQGAE